MQHLKERLNLSVFLLTRCLMSFQHLPTSYKLGVEIIFLFSIILEVYYN